MYVMTWIWFFNLFVLCLTVGRVKSDYYWKEYNGVIPEDAFPGGTDMGGNPTYIGQTFFPDKNILTPTIIERGERNASINLSDVRISSDLDTKILCSANNSLFRWIPTDTKKIHYLTGCRQIYGGSTWGATVTIGRANHQGRTVVGRLYDYTPSKLHGLWIPSPTWKDIALTEFEVLTYNCENPWVEDVK